MSFLIETVILRLFNHLEIWKILSVTVAATKNFCTFFWLPKIRSTKFGLFLEWLLLNKSKIFSKSSVRSMETTPLENIGWYAKQWADPYWRWDHPVSSFPAWKFQAIILKTILTFSSFSVYQTIWQCECAVASE